MSIPLTQLVTQKTGAPPGMVGSTPASADGTPSPGAGGFARAMRDFYAEVDAAVAAHAPVCVNRGQCCRFDTFGHRLYVTAVEMMYFAKGLADRPLAPTDGACPYQIEGRCTARDHRPLGCRVFFCEERSQAWQGPEYERFLARLKEIGEAFAIPYRYGEWLAALDEAFGPVEGGADAQPSLRPGARGP